MFKIWKSFSSYTYPNDMISLIQKGLPKSSDPKHVIIISAGMAGLISASLLKSAGHEVTILESNRNYKKGEGCHTLSPSFHLE